MKLSKEAMQVMAECISRSEHVTVETNGVIEESVWCERCSLNTGAIFAMKGITETAVYDMGTVTACAIHGIEGDA